jgi:hypothetical protein
MHVCMHVAVYSCDVCVSMGRRGCVPVCARARVCAYWGGQGELSDGRLSLQTHSAQKFSPRLRGQGNMTPNLYLQLLAIPTAPLKSLRTNPLRPPQNISCFLVFSKATVTFPL